MFHNNQFLILFISIGFLPYFYSEGLGYELIERTEQEFSPALDGRFIVSIQASASKERANPKHLCNGVIVNESFVITSEQCIKNASKFVFEDDNFDNLQVST